MASISFRLLTLSSAVGCQASDRSSPAGSQGRRRAASLIPADCVSKIRRPDRPEREWEDLGRREDTTGVGPRPGAQNLSI